MGTTSAASAIFTGSSQFSSEFQQSIQNAVSIASQPMDAMQTDLTNLTSQQTALNTLNTDLANVQTAINQIQSATGLNALAASVSTPSVASVALSGTPDPATYSIDITSAGIYATSMSDTTGATTVSDPSTGNISDATSYTLSMGTAQFTITPSANTLEGLMDALNQSGQVQAVVVNLGSTAAPNYVLSVQGTQWGDLPIQLTANDGSTPGVTLLTPETTGAEATYQVDGAPAISTNTPTVTISPGVTATLLAEGSTTITVSQSTWALSSALSSLATAYNTAMTDLNKNHGQSGGALTGHSIVMELSSALHSLINYSNGTSGISSLASLGLSFADDTGVLSFDSTSFAKATSGQAAELASFLGSATTGGFLQAASNTMTGLDGPINGLLTGELNTIANQITTENTHITDQQNKVNQLQANLTTQMAQTDAAIATLEQQFLSLQTLFTDMQQDEAATML